MCLHEVMCSHSGPQTYSNRIGSNALLQVSIQKNDGEIFNGLLTENYDTQRDLTLFCSIITQWTVGWHQCKQRFSLLLNFSHSTVYRLCVTFSKPLCCKLDLPCFEDCSTDQQNECRSQYFSFKPLMLLQTWVVLFTSLFGGETAKQKVRSTLKKKLNFQSVLLFQ